MTVVALPEQDASDAASDVSDAASDASEAAGDVPKEAVAEDIGARWLAAPAVEPHAAEANDGRSRRRRWRGERPQQPTLASGQGDGFGSTHDKLESDVFRSTYYHDEQERERRKLRRRMEQAELEAAEHERVRLEELMEQRMEQRRREVAARREVEETAVGEDARRREALPDAPAPADDHVEEELIDDLLQKLRTL